MTPRLSIVIRCRNEGDDLRRVFGALEAQDCGFAWETVVVDNESTDDTVAVAREHGARVVSIRRADFTYGRALNVGINDARGELVLILSAHAMPVGSRFLEGAVAPFADPMMAAARCLLIGKSEQMAGWFTPKDIQYASRQEQQAAERGHQWVTEYPTAGCCVIRRAVWEETRYDETLESNEDKLWASQVLARGYKIRSCADAVWFYTRRYGPAELSHRKARQHLALYRITGDPPMTWGRYFLLAGRYLVASPIVAVRYVVSNIAYNTQLVTIPWRARRAPKSGSLPEFDRRPERPLNATER